MSSWYSNLVTKTSSQISNLRSTLLSSEADGDTEDDTHVCRVLRNYYTEKGRPFPNWLPPDPKAPPPQMTQAVYAQSQVGSRYGGLGGPQQPGAGGLSSLWDSGPAQPPQPQIPQSLRAGRPATTQPGTSTRDELLGRGGQAPRAGSYSGPGPAPAGSAQDRLKQRLWGTRTTSPSSSNVMRTGLRQGDLTITPGEEEEVVVVVSRLLEQTLLGRVTVAPMQEEEEEEEELQMEYEEKDCPAVHGDIDEGGKMCPVSFP
ncbi:uncharacterized protein Triagg1_7991 [Trichoderma aggressivum f. europaeum]|uniref:Mso1 N-terminal domain-containing protein n=1 Tax=Trichoderma aggressivum f. europaeum TaxID=173218 RepID=A0AAE1IAT5_9HYPO|nr:hypothetical protein Triagg1_7991 [Trichoderma aggressivum f. europaeum]